MADEVESRVLQLFRMRMQRDPTISEQTSEVLLDGGVEGSFGDDDQLLTELVDAGRQWRKRHSIRRMAATDRVIVRDRTSVTGW